MDQRFRVLSVPVLFRQQGSGLKRLEATCNE